MCLLRGCTSKTLAAAMKVELYSPSFVEVDGSHERWLVRCPGQALYEANPYYAAT